MATLRISLFGSLRIQRDDWPEIVRVTHAVEALLAYLLLERNRTHARSVLAGLFWGDECEQRARSCLKTALWRARRALEPDGVAPGTYIITTPNGEVGFNPQSDHWLDIQAFEQAVATVARRPPAALTADDAKSLERALQLYTGELLEGLYDDWALAERERLRALYLQTLTTLIRYYRQQTQFDQALACGHKVLAVDPLREEIHRDLMRLYLDTGQRALAVRQYETCRRVLAEELGIEPMAETQALYAHVISVSPPAALHAQPATTADLQQTLCQLRMALDSVEQVRQLLQQTLTQLGRTL